MGALGVLLFIATSGVTIYYLPVMIYGIPWEYLIEIRNSKELYLIESILKEFGWNQTTAREDALKAVIVCSIISILIVLVMIRAIGKTVKPEPIKEFKIL